MKKIRLHSYLLLELLIAVTLITLCLLPYLHIPIAVVKDELLSIQRLQLQHVGDRTYAWIKERMYQNEIPWEQLVHAQEKKMLLVEDFITLPIKELAAQRFARTCYLSSSYKKGLNDEEYCLVTIKVIFKKIPKMAFLFSSKQKKKTIVFSYKIFVRQRCTEPDAKMGISSEEKPKSDF